MSIPQIFNELKSEITATANSWQGVSASNIPWKVYEGDARAVLTHLEDNSFNCCITSPPYYNLRDYGVENQIGLEETITEYVTKLTSVMDEVRKKLKTDGLLFLNIGDTYYSGKGQSQGTDRKSNKRRFGLRPVDKSGGVGIGIQRKSVIGV